MDSAIEISSGSSSSDEDIEEVPQKAENDEMVIYQKGSLPLDLIEEILSRVPTKSVARLRSTSKQWNALLKSWRFAKKHSANAPKGESLSIMLIDSRVCLVKINLQGSHNNDVAPSVKVVYQYNLKDPLSNSDSSQVDISRVFHCDGLLLCTTRDGRLVVWNPCSEETEWIQPSNKYKEPDVYALGYDSSCCSCKRYKILRVDHFAGFQNEHEIYDFSTSDSWRLLPDSSSWSLQGGCCRGVSVKGITYWIALDSTEEGDYFLQSFDFTTEKFQSLSLPHPFPYLISDLSVIREEQLSLFGTVYQSTEIHVWVRSSTGSWSKFLTVRDCLTISISASFLVYEQNRVVVCCDEYMHGKELHILGDNNYIRVAHDGGHSDMSLCSDLQSYVPSLAQIQQCGVLRKRKAPESS